MRVLRMLGGALIVLGLIAPAAGADEWNKLTYLTFSGPVQVPGHTLPAGTYMFKLADSPANRHIVQIFDKEGTKLYATLLAIPDQRLEPADKPVVMFRETPAGTPAAVRAWFYPGNTIGDEFVYPKEQAMRIAKAIHQPVLSMASGDVKTAEVTRIDESGVGATGTSGTTSAPAASAKATEPAPAPSAPRPNVAAEPRTLPRTASPLALYGLISGLSLAGAYGMRRLRNR